MTHPLLALFVLAQTRLWRAADDDRERGDVPGWVLITIMTAGLVTAIWAVAGPRLGTLLDNALSSVSGPNP